MGSRWTHALPLCCLLGFIFVDTMTVSAEVTATHGNGASPLQASQIRRIQPHKENTYRIDMKTGSFEVVDDNNNDTALTQRQDTVTVTGSMQVVGGPRNGSKLCVSGQGYEYCKSDGSGGQSSKPSIRGQVSEFRRLVRLREATRLDNGQKRPKMSLKEFYEQNRRPTALVPKQLQTLYEHNKQPALVNAVRPRTPLIRKTARNSTMPRMRMTLQALYEKNNRSTFAYPNTGPSRDRRRSSDDHAPALDNTLPRHWRTPQESQDPSASSRKRRNTPELSTGSWTVFSGNKTATVTSFSGLQDQIRKKERKKQLGPICTVRELASD